MLRKILKDVCKTFMSIGQPLYIRGSIIDEKLCFATTSNDGLVILRAYTPNNNMIENLKFGMGNLKSLSQLLDLEMYNTENSKFEIKYEEKQNEKILSSFIFKDENSGKSIYKLMNPKAITELIPRPVLKNYEIEITPSADILKTFNSWSNVFTDQEKTFGTLVEDNKLYFGFGDLETHKISTNTGKMFISNVSENSFDIKYWDIFCFLSLIRVCNKDTLSIKISKKIMMCTWTKDEITYEICFNMMDRK